MIHRPELLEYFCTFPAGCLNQNRLKQLLKNVFFLFRVSILSSKQILFLFFKMTHKKKSNFSRVERLALFLAAHDFFVGEKQRAPFRLKTSSLLSRWKKWNKKKCVLSCRLWKKRVGGRERWLNWTLILMVRDTAQKTRERIIILGRANLAQNLSN